MNIDFQFDSFAAFFYMAGHGPYVWAAYALTFISVILLVASARIKRKKIAKLVAINLLRESDLKNRQTSPA